MCLIILIIMLAQGAVIQTKGFENETGIFADQGVTETTEKVKTLYLTNPGRIITIQIETKDQTVILPCEVDGNPKPTNIEWSKDGNAISEDSRYEYMYKTINSTLELLNPYYNDDGEYTCHVCNAHECINSTIVLELDFILHKDSMTSISVIEGSDAVFYCDIIATEIYAKKYYIKKWRSMQENLLNLLLTKTPDLVSDNYEQTENATNWNILQDRGKYAVMIKNVTKKDQGWYTCMVSKYDNNFTEHVLAYKHAFLEVHGMYQLNKLIVVIITIIFITLSLITTIALRRLKQRKKFYERLIKIVTIRNQPNPNDYQSFQIPSVTIEIRRSLVAMNTNYQISSLVEYEFPIDLNWEFSRDNLSFGELLGAGAFGNVVKANAEGLQGEGVSTTVAVKMLKDDHTDEEVKDLVCEMEIMKNIGGHPNIINFLGCCTQNGPLLIIVEHAAHGNLKNFLQTDSSKTFNSQQLVSFASQIVSGMLHLSSKKLIHRDLAARNILVSEGLIMKIADFGLARDVYNQEYYRKITSGKLPIRWMAPESLEERFFNTKSDVWSFGVLLWEIMTRGRDPYPFVTDWQSFLEYLKQGNRLEQPRDCPDVIYNVMELCWEFKPENRPSFDPISGMLECNAIEDCLESKENMNLNNLVCSDEFAV